MLCLLRPTDIFKQRNTLLLIVVINCAFTERHIPAKRKKKRNPQQKPYQYQNFHALISITYIP